MRVPIERLWRLSGGDTVQLRRPLRKCFHHVIKAEKARPFSLTLRLTLRPTTPRLELLRLHRIRCKIISGARSAIRAVRWRSNLTHFEVFMSTVCIHTDR